MPKIVHIIQSAEGGGSTVALNYFPRYQDTFETIVITGRNGTLAKQLQEKGLKVHAVLPTRARNCLLYFPLMSRILQKEQPDIVVVHGQWAGMSGALAARMARIRNIIYITHLPSFYADYDFVGALRNRIAEQVTCSLSRIVVALTKASRYQYLLRHLAEGKLVHVPNGIDLNRIQPSTDRPSARQALGLPEKGLFAVSVGRFDENQKRLDWLLQAWKQVEQKIPAAELYLIGDGPARPSLEALSKTLGLCRCHFLGSKQEGGRYFAAADIGVVTSMFEGGNPLTMLEAMGYGCPVVGTAADGIAETIVDGANGLCVSVADPSALASAICTLLADPEATAILGRKARLYVEAHHNIEESINRQIELAKSLLKKGP